MKHQLKQVFHSGKFVFGFVLFMVVLLAAIIYPAVSRFGALEMVGSIFYPPGTYIAQADAAVMSGLNFNIDTQSGRFDKLLIMEDREKMITWLVKYGGLPEDSLDVNNPAGLISTWQETYDQKNPQKGLLLAEKKAYIRLNNKLANMINSEDLILAAKDDQGNLVESATIASNTWIRTEDVSNRLTLPLGSDNFGRDVLTELTNAIRVSLQIGLIAGGIATLIGLTIGLMAGFVGGVVDNILTFITNIFTVIPSFVILILIANSIGRAARGPQVVAVIIGLTAWPWTARSVRSQVISLRNRDHVNLSKLSGHSLPRIILQDILPYVASYVVMALILQISSAILSEAMLSMLGLGPSTSNTATLGMMMNWANQFQALISGAWWAFIPVILSIGVISFSLNLMNTGLDQVFNPQLRD